MTGSRARIVVEVMVALGAAALLYGAWHCDAQWFERHVQEFRCMRDPRNFRSAMFWRCFAVVVGVLLVLVVRPRLGRWAGRQTPRGLLGLMPRVVLPTVLALGVCEVYFRRTQGPDARTVRPDLPAILVSDTPLTWTLEPSRTMTWHIDGHDVEYALSSGSFRVASAKDEPDLSAPTILVVGESVVFGVGLRHEDTFAAMLARRLGVQVINAGVHGYGGDQTYLRTMEVLPQLARPLAVVTIVLPEMVERNVLENRSRLRMREDGAFEPVLPTPEWVRELRLRRLWRNIWPNGDEAVTLERAYLLEAARSTRARGALPLFLVTNYHTPCLPVRGEAPWLYRTLFAGDELLHVDVPIDLAWKLRDDPHPNARAHEAMAEALERALRDAKLPGL